MKKTNKDVKSFISLLDKYKFSKVQDYGLSVKPKIFKKVSKVVGIFHIFSGFFISIYFLFKKLGISLTLTKIILSSVAAISLAYGGYNIVIKLSEQKIDKNQDIAIEIDNLFDINKKNKKEISKVENYNLGIKPFTSNNVDDKIIKTIQKNILLEVSRIKGRNFTNFISKKHTGKYKYYLVGHVDKVGDTNTIIVKVIESETSSIKFITREKFKSIDELEIASKAISQNLVKEIE